MTPAETADFLRLFNAWRRGDDDYMSQPDPRKLGLAIDAAVGHLEEIERLRTELAMERRLSFRDRFADLEVKAERLRAQNAILTDAINAASALMASAPAWHQMHREAIEQLQRVRKEMES